MTDARQTLVDEVDGQQVPLLQLRSPLPDVVTTVAQLASVIDSFRRGTGPVAIDAERASGYRYSQRAYLIQMRREGAGTALIDPVPFGPPPNTALAPLAEAIVDAEWVIHAASQDVPCLAEVGLRPRLLFDTELAGRLLNFPRVGLALLVEELLGSRMRKEHSAVDWSRRPLPEPWLVYAALDVEVLIELRDIMAARLDEAGKSAWAAQEFAYWAAMKPSAPREEPWRRTSGIHRVRGRRGLAMVRSMWQLREQIAERRDISSRRIVPDAALIDAAVAAPRSRTALARLPAFTTRSSQRWVREFMTAVQQALALPDAELPSLAPAVDGPPPPRTWVDKNPEAAQRLGRARTVVTAIASENDLPVENLVSPDAVRRLAWSPPAIVDVEAVAEELRSHGARPWQVGLTAESLSKALNGAPSGEPNGEANDVPAQGPA